MPLPISEVGENPNLCGGVVCPNLEKLLRLIAPGSRRRQHYLLSRVEESSYDISKMLLVLFTRRQLFQGLEYLAALPNGRSAAHLNSHR